MLLLLLLVISIQGFESYDHFSDLDNPISWNATATAFTLEFFDPGACQYNYREYAYSTTERYMIALPGPDFESGVAGSCGKCLWAETPYNKIEVVVVDECSGCEQTTTKWGGVDLDAFAYAQLANLEEDYEEWRKTFDEWLTNEWWGTLGHESTEYPQYWDYPNGIYPAGEGSMTIKLTPKYCSDEIMQNSNVKLRIQFKDNYYIEITVVKSTLNIGQIKMSADGLEPIDMTCDTNDNVWHNAGNSFEFSAYNNQITLEIIPLFFPDERKTVTINIPAENVKAGNDLDDIDLGFKFESKDSKDENDDENFGNRCTVLGFLMVLCLLFHV